MKQTAFTLLVFCMSLASLSAQTLHWAVQNEVSILCSTRVLTYGADGSVVNAGVFQGTMDLDPGAAVDMHTSQNNTADVFVQKLDSNGNYIWGRSWQGTQNEDVQGLLVDDNGNIYIAGAFESGWDADPGTGSFNLSGIGFESFLLKLDPNGDFLWAKNTENHGFAGETRSGGLEMDAAGNLLVAGSFRHTVDFDPGTGVDTLQNTTISGANPMGTYPNCFLWRLDTSGNHLGVFHNVANASSTVSGLKVDDHGNRIVYGTFFGTADFDPSAGTSNLTGANFSSGYVQKLDSVGALIWVRQIGAFIDHIDTDVFGDLYLGGVFSNTVDFDPGAGTQNMSTVNGNFDGYVVKWDVNGNFDWNAQFGGGSGETVVAVEMAPNGHLFVLGKFRDSIDLDPGPAMVQAAGPLNEKAFMVSMDATGSYNWGWAIDPGNSNPIRPWALAINADGDFAVAGDFGGTFDFDPGPSSTVLNSPTGFDGFVAQWADTSTVVGISPNLENASIQLFPNPNQGTFKLSSTENLHEGRITIIDMQGRILEEFYFDQMKTLRLDLEMPAGLYLVRVESQEQNAQLRIQVH